MALLATKMSWLWIKLAALFRVLQRFCLSPLAPKVGELVGVLCGPSYALAPNCSSYIYLIPKP